MEYSFVVTQDTVLLEKYYRLREACFRKELGIPGFDGGEDDYDRAGTVLLAVGRGRRVLAGARIYGNHPGQGRCLPMENRRFRLRNHFPTLELNRRPYCHWGRLVIDPEVRGKVFPRRFLGRLLDCSAAHGYHYAFIITDRYRSRYYRQLHRSLGYDYHICKTEVPSGDRGFGGLEHLVSYAVLPSGDSAVAPTPVEPRRETFLQGLDFAPRASNEVPLRLVESHGGA